MRNYIMSQIRNDDDIKSEECDEQHRANQPKIKKIKSNFPLDEILNPMKIRQSLKETNIMERDTIFNHKAQSSIHNAEFNKKLSWPNEKNVYNDTSEKSSTSNKDHNMTVHKKDKGDKKRFMILSQISTPKNSESPYEKWFKRKLIYSNEKKINKNIKNLKSQNSKSSIDIDMAEINKIKLGEDNDFHRDKITTDISYSFKNSFNIINEVNFELCHKTQKKLIFTDNKIHFQRGFNIYKNNLMISNEVQYESNKDLGILDDKIRIKEKGDKIELVTSDISFQLLNISKDKVINQTEINRSMNLSFENCKQIDKNTDLLLDNSETNLKNTIRTYQNTCIIPKVEYSNTQSDKFIRYVNTCFKMVNLMSLRRFKNKMFMEKFFKIWRGNINPKLMIKINTKSIYNEDRNISFSIFHRSYQKSVNKIYNIFLKQKFKEDHLIRNKFYKWLKHVKQLNFYRKKLSENVKKLRKSCNDEFSISYEFERIPVKNFKSHQINPFSCSFDKKQKICLMIYKIYKIIQNNNIKFILRKKFRFWSSNKYLPSKYDDELSSRKLIYKNIKENYAKSLIYNQKQISQSSFIEKREILLKSLILNAYKLRSSLRNWSSNLKNCSKLSNGFSFLQSIQNKKSTFNKKYLFDRVSSIYCKSLENDFNLIQNTQINSNSHFFSFCIGVLISILGFYLIFAFEILKFGFSFNTQSIYFIGFLIVLILLIFIKDYHIKNKRRQKEIEILGKLKKCRGGSYKFKLEESSSDFSSETSKNNIINQYYKSLFNKALSNENFCDKLIQ